MDILWYLGISLFLAGLLLLLGGFVLNIKPLRKYFAIGMIKDFFVMAGSLYLIGSVFVFILIGLYGLVLVD